MSQHGISQQSLCWLLFLHFVMHSYGSDLQVPGRSLAVPFVAERLDPLSDALRGVEDEEYWDRYYQTISSFPLPQPTMVPSIHGPTDTSPTQVPTPNVPVPVNTPTTRPVTPTPTTLSPVTVPTITPNPSTSPSFQSLPPTNLPTSRCQVDLDLRCTYGQNGMPCEDISPENDLLCSCTDCAREIIFRYTGNSCGDFDGCHDIGKASHAVSRVVISNSYDLSDILYEELLNDQSLLVLSRSDGSCLPGLLNVQINSGISDQPIQVQSIDTSCGGGNLQLLQSYGSLDFVGYSCSDTDVHNCFIDVLYEVESCNIGSSNESLMLLGFDLNNNYLDLMASGMPSNGLVLGANECYKVSQSEVVDVCQSRDYHAKAVVGAANSQTSVASCQDLEELKFGWELQTTHPTVTPTSAPSPQPSLRPSSDPTARPINLDSTEYMADQCNSRIRLECVTNDEYENNCVDIVEESNTVCHCSECPKELVFKYTGGICDDSREEPEYCLDNINATSPARILITAGDNMNDILYNGVRQIGTMVHVKSVIGKCLPTTLSVTVFSLDGTNTVIQTQAMNTNCAETSSLRLTRSYGAMEFVGYTCDETDVHNCNLEVYYKASACNTEENVDLVLYDMGFELNGSHDNLLGVTAPRILQPGECVQYAIPSTVQRCDGTNYLATLAVDMAKEDYGPHCLVKDEVSFNTYSSRSSFEDSASVILDETVESSDQLSNPEIETEEPCKVEANIQCQVIDRVDTQSCDDLAPSTNRECRGDNVVVESLTFNYTGLACSTNETPADCLDLSDADRERVVVIIRGRDYTIYTQETVSIGDIVHVTKPVGILEILVETVAVNNSEMNQGELLQRIVFNPICRQDAISPTLTLGDDYGALNLVSIETDEFGLMSIFAEVEINFSIANPSSVHALVIGSAVVSSSLTGRLGEQQIGRRLDDEIVGVPSGDSVAVLVERRRINLTKEDTQAFVFALRAVAFSPTPMTYDREEHRIVCSDMSTMFFRVQDNSMSSGR